MEVHHHPHVEKKRFREYLLEFIMIFLAVTLGFFAENIREKISDSRQVHQYIRSMVNDLNADLRMYHSYDSANLVYCGMVDTICSDMEDPHARTGRAYYLARRLTMMGAVTPGLDEKTYSQMTSTGSFRLIHRQAVADSIALYYQLIKSFDYWADLQRQRINDLISTNEKVFDARGFFLVYRSIEQGKDRATIEENCELPYLTREPLALNAVLMHHQYFYGFLKLMNGRCEMAARRAEGLISLLRKEYSITNE